MKQRSFVKVLNSWIEDVDFSNCECGPAIASFNLTKARLSLWWEKGASAEIKVDDMIVVPQEDKLFVRVWGRRGKHECRFDLEMQKFYLH